MSYINIYWWANTIGCNVLAGHSMDAIEWYCIEMINSLFALSLFWLIYFYRTHYNNTGCISIRTIVSKFHFQFTKFNNNVKNWWWWLVLVNISLYADHSQVKHKWLYDHERVWVRRRKSHISRLALLYSTCKIIFGFVPIDIKIERLSEIIISSDCSIVH